MILSSCIFEFNIFLLVALTSVLSLLVGYEETTSGSHRSLLVEHIGPSHAFLSDMGSCLP